jgi:hypothetical protein
MIRQFNVFRHLNAEKRYRFAGTGYTNQAIGSDRLVDLQVVQQLVFYIPSNWNYKEFVAKFNLSKLLVRD